ncbi:MAG TPA: uroporphyrinogen decarboxylase family protein [Oscillospiraceae bacterium]|nr:uroporphyrinogen decarboxylase family protein [Oscillospiraceae bacterium]
MVSPEMQKLAQERAARMQAALDLKEPDRVPFGGLGGDVIAAYAGISAYEYEFDFDKNRQAAIKWLKDFPADNPTGGIGGLDNLAMSVSFVDFPDLANQFFMVNGPMNDALNMKFARFPGRQLNEYSSRQFIGGSNMSADEYDALIADPVKFSYETILPRIAGNLAELGSPASLAAMARLGIVKAQQAAEMRKTGAALAELGYPQGGGSTFAFAPLDYIGDHLRDLPNVVLDIRKCPDKVKAAAEAILEVLFKFTMQGKAVGAKTAGFPLHLNEYLSPKLYREFYWPTLKDYILRLGEEGMKSRLFCEGWHDPHLDTFLELPAGWGTAAFEKTDVRKAKKMLQGHTCISGGLETGVIISGTPAKIDEFVKRLLGDMMPGGGFILGADVGNLPRNTPIENIQAVYEAVEKYGKY